MISYCIPRRQSTSSIAFVAVLVYLLFASVTLASPVKDACFCTEDPDRKPRKNKTCKWLQGMKPKKQRKFCKKLKKKGKICPITCGLWSSTPKRGPKEAKPCDSPGLTCYCNYEYINGCDSTDSITCAPIDTYKCDSGKWTKSSFMNLPCVGFLMPPAGKKCDPTDCPFNEPGDRTSCLDSQIGKRCSYDYKVFGCSPEEEQCTATKFYDCREAPKGDPYWALGLVDPPSCDEPVVLEPCDPGSFCPSEPPEEDSACNAAQVGLDCPYDYVHLGCHFQDGYSCIAMETYYCNKKEKWKVARLMVDPCFDPDPNNPMFETCEPCPTVLPVDSCPVQKPKPGKDCSIDSEVECQYDFRHRGCEAGKLECRPGSRFYCNDGQWEEGVAIPEEPCPPTNKPCPDEKPNANTPCRMYGYDLGLECKYDYLNFSCTEGEVDCSPTEFYTCSEMGWELAVVDPGFCGDDKDPPTFLEPCDPGSFCPSDPPEEDSACNAAQVGLDCKYDYVHLGCHFQDGYSCTALETYSCNEEEKWKVARLTVEPCFDPDPNNPMFETCEPCPTVLPVDSCPVQKPKPGKDCSIDSEVECQYDFRHRGCEAGELECRPGSRFYCNDGQWEEGVAIPEEPCPPTNKPCPDEKPNANTPCRTYGYDLGLECKYDYLNFSCTEGEVDCFPTEFYTCSEMGWELEVVAPVPCEDDKDPPTFLDPCTP